MVTVHKQVLAEQDLVNIWLYTQREWGEKQADAYLDDLERTLLLLAEQPYLGRERREFSPFVRTHLHAHHLIVYQLVDNGINIVRVLHKCMDIDDQLS